MGPDFPSLAEEIAEPRPYMNIRATAFTVSKKLNYIKRHALSHITLGSLPIASHCYCVCEQGRELEHLYSNILSSRLFFPNPWSKSGSFHMFRYITGYSQKSLSWSNLTGLLHIVSQDMRFSTMWYVRLTKAQTSLYMFRESHFSSPS